jgi:hypothetical protein
MCVTLFWFVTLFFGINHGGQKLHKNLRMSFLIGWNLFHQTQKVHPTFHLKWWLCWQTMTKSTFISNLWILVCENWRQDLLILSTYFQIPIQSMHILLEKQNKCWNMWRVLAKIFLKNCPRFMKHVYICNLVYVNGLRNIRTNPF